MEKDTPRRHIRRSPNKGDNSPPNKGDNNPSNKGDNSLSQLSNKGDKSPLMQGDPDAACLDTQVDSISKLKPQEDKDNESSNLYDTQSFFDLVRQYCQKIIAKKSFGNFILGKLKFV